MARTSAAQTILTLLQERESVRNRDVAGALGISRQATYKHLRALVESGELVVQGTGRGTRYQLATARIVRRYETAGLEEDRVWDDLVERTRLLSTLAEAASRRCQYALTELVNNAVDHSGSDHATVVVERTGQRLALEVIDQGVGMFEHVRERLGLDTQLEALQEISKGKATTLPEQHTGEGIFFVSKAAEVFRARSGGLLWIIDNTLPDVAVLELSPPQPGTVVRFETDPEDRRDLKSIFERYTDDFEFSRTHTSIKLFAVGVEFVSRSEARRLLTGLERFRVVEMDFSGVRGIGQGFADEVFRVWARRHPEVTLIPMNMTPPVEMMVRHGQSQP